MTTHQRSLLTALTVGAAMLLPTTAGAAEQMIQQPEPEQTSHFSVFQTPPEGLPPTQTAMLEKAVESRPGNTGFLAGTGLNPSLAQKLDAGGKTLAVVPGRGYMVLVSWTRNGLTVTAPTTPTRTAIRHGLRLGKNGLVPDGVIAVRVTKIVKVPVLADHIYNIAGALRLHGRETFWQYPKLIRGARSSTVKSSSSIEK